MDDHTRPVDADRMDDRTRSADAEPERSAAGPARDGHEQEAWAEHDAALEATLFGRRPMLELELRDGKLRIR
jgi:hypothetical protein